MLKLLHYNEAQSNKLIAQFANGKRYASYLSLIEFNTGLLASVLKFRKIILELNDVAQAYSEMSDEFGRDPKNGMLFTSILFRYTSTINTDDPLEFVDLLDEVAIEMHTRVTKMVKQFIGQYSKHRSAILSVVSVEDFKLFPRQREKGWRPDLSDFWSKYIQDIANFRNALEGLEKDGSIKAKEKELLELARLILTAPTSVITHTHKNDFAITLEAPLSHEVVAYDHIFDITVLRLGKSGGFVSVPKRPN